MAVTELQFVQVPHQFYNGRGSDKGVSPTSIRVYCMLEQYRLFYYQKVIMSIDVLSSLMQVRSRPDRNKMAIRGALTELQTKGYITIDCRDGQFNNNSTLVIGKTEIEHGFTKVDVAYYQRLSDVDEFAPKVHNLL